MGELDVRENLKKNLAEALAKVTQKPDCWTPGVGSRVGWEAKFIPFPAVDVIDFFIHFSAPVRGLLWCALNSGSGVGPSFSFMPQNVALSTTFGSSNQTFGMFTFTINNLLLFEEDIQDIYVSVPGVGAPGAQLAIMGVRGIRALYSNV